MKKLLITTLAAVSVGLCAKAEDTSTFTENGTSFEGLTAGDVFNPPDTDTYWTIPTDTDDVFKITNVTYSADATKQHWDWTDGEMALSIDTANPILRNVNPVPQDDTTIINPPQDVTTPVFFDSVVQFTATDVAPSMENNTTDKLAVWLYTSPDDVSDTNLGLFGETSPITRVAVTAGYLDGATLKTKNYITNIEVEPDTWHRLTIKSFKNDIGDLLFNIWVDRTQVSGKETFEGQTTMTDFLSRISDAVNSDTYNKLQAVAFDGKGAVDDIVFTTTAPEFAKEDEPEAPKVFALNLSISADEVAEATVLTVYADGEEAKLEDGSWKLNVGTENALAWVYCAEAYKVINEGATYDEEGGYWIVPINVAGATENGTVNVTITVEEAGGGSGVTVDGTPVEFDNDGMIANITTAFDGKAVSGELDTTKFKSYYTAKVENGILSIKLDQKAAAPFAEATEDKEVLEVGEDASGNPKLTVRIKPYVGLYYGAMTGSALDNLTLTSNYQEATTADVIEFTATGKAGDTAGFIKVVVTDIAPESTEE